jgi:hypothetical protein
MQTAAVRMLMVNNEIDQTLTDQASSGNPF